MRAWEIFTPALVESDEEMATLRAEKARVEIALAKQKLHQQAIETKADAIAADLMAPASPPPPAKQDPSPEGVEIERFLRRAEAGDRKMRRKK